VTDGRIPGMWVNQPRFIEMDVDTWCIFTKAIAWSNEAGTDGHIKRRYLQLLHPDGERPHSYSVLADMGLWTPVADGYQFVNWSKKATEEGLGQATAEQVEANKKSARERSQRSRDRAKQGKAQTPATGDVTRDVPRDVGQGQGPGLGQEGFEELEEEFKNLDPDTGELLPAPSSEAVGGEHEEESPAPRQPGWRLQELLNSASA
jgi:hypothetical protein